MAFRFAGYDVCHYGHLSWITPLLAFFGLWLFLFPAFRCSLTVGKPSGGEYEIFIGYWKRENLALAVANGPENDGNVCGQWINNDFFDGIWKFGRAVGAFGAMTCPIALVFDILFLFMRVSLSWFYPILALHVFNATMSILLLVGLASFTCEIDNCRIARGGYVAIVSFIVWLVLAYFVWLLRKRELDMPDRVIDNYPQHPNEKPREEPSETEPDVEQPLALPASENSRRKMPRSKNDSSSPYPALPMSENAKNYQSKRSVNDNRKMPDNDTDSERRLALPMSDSTRSQPKRSTRKMNANNNNRDTEQPSSSTTTTTTTSSPIKKKKKKVLSEEPAPPASTNSRLGADGKPKGRTKKRTPVNKPQE